MERDELQRNLKAITCNLEQYAGGQYLPDAGRENGLQADKKALGSRLRAVERTLAAQEGGPKPDE